MFSFTKGHCNVTIYDVRCRCQTGRCSIDPHGAGDVEALKCYRCSHRMWDHDDLLPVGDFGTERRRIGSPPPYEGPANSTQRSPGPLALPNEPARSHYFSRMSEPIRAEPRLVTSDNDGISLPRYNTEHQQVPRPNIPPRTCTTNLIIGIILGFVIVVTPIIAYRAVT